MELFKPGSIRKPHGKKGYDARTEAHDFRVISVTGPRGGDLGYSISLPFGSLQGCQQGETERSRQLRDEQLASTIDHYISLGWLADKTEADRLSAIHACARSSAIPSKGGQGERTRFRFAAAEQAVYDARK